MAVSTINKTDAAGSLMDSSITQLNAQLALINKNTSPLTYHRVAQALDQAQQDAVKYYMSIGRILASNILSTLS